MSRGVSQTALAMPEASLEVISGEVESVRVMGDDFWGIAQVRPTTGAGVATVVGKLLGTQPGDSVQVRGCWTEHAKYGRQFRAKAIKVTVPSSAAGVIAWLASRLPQLGKARATQLVERFGADIWAVIEQRPDELLGVEGITAQRRDAIVEAYHRHRAERDRMVRLKGYGLSDHQIGQVLATWGDGADDILRDNPYRLSEDVRGFGFKRADQVARRMGLALDAPARIRAGLLYVLEEAEGHGHVYVPQGKLIALGARLLQLPEPEVAGQVGAVIGSGQAVARRGRVYRPALDRAEAQVAARVAALCKRAA